MKKGQRRVDEFAFVLLAGIILIFMLMIIWTTPLESSPSVQPLAVELDLAKGSASTFDITITGELTNVTLTAGGEIKSWLSFNKNRFNIIDSTIVTVTIKVPSTVSERLYTGNVLVESPGGKQTVSVNIQIGNVTELLSFRPISLGDFTVTYASSSETLDSKSNIEVINGYFANQEANLVGIVEEQKLPLVSSSAITLVVTETNSVGNLIVIVNGQEVYNKKAAVGELVIPVDKSLIQRSNTVNIKAGSPGWMFWANTVYKIRSVEFDVNFEGVITREIPFILSSTEVDKFDHFLLTFRVRANPAELAPLIIEINDQVVYLQTPPLTLFNKELSKDILDNPLFLRDGENTISFSFEQPATFEVLGANLVIYHS